MQHTAEIAHRGTDVEQRPASVWGLRIQVDGAIDKVEIPKVNGTLLHGLYAAIGCQLVECVRLTDTVDMWIDEEGLYTARPNRVATAVAHHFQQDVPPQWRQTYHGTVVFLGISQATGVSLSLDGVQDLGAQQLAALQDVAATL